jgi:hypothetical protein
MNSSIKRNPQELLDRYLQAVRFWLPKSPRHEDVLAELGEDLRSQIEEKETELGCSLSAQETAAILKGCGSPMMVAGRLGPRRHLIGSGSVSHLRLRPEDGAFMDSGSCLHFYRWSGESGECGRRLGVGGRGHAG